MRQVRHRRDETTSKPRSDRIPSERVARGSTGPQLGRGCRPQLDRFSVTVLYREPTYERRFGKKRLAHRFTFRVAADSVDAAREQALAEFETWARLSGVSWIREVVGTLVLPDRCGDR